ncbi:MAG TPA: lysylphosphatidylglycerol synthase transmembrane domain-containing protein [Vicinamibacterales bacterium]|nr:lysylphosphatidylglycerol synthase transmembrane domain-containing protein [Vicinamibacterales bacterium]
MIPDPPHPRPLRRILLPLGKLLFSAALIALLFSRIDAAKLWAMARTASPAWLLTAMVIYLVMILASAWRWGLLLKAQGIAHEFRTLTASFLAATFFNNFLPSNIGGDVIRVTDTAVAAGSKTLAATVVLIDRGIGLLGLVLVAAIGATAGPRLVNAGPGVGAPMLWAAFGAATLFAALAVFMPRALPRLLRPLRLVHPEWVDERLARLHGALHRFSKAPAALAGCFGGAIFVQATLVAFYLAIARSMQIPVGFAELAFIVPISFVIQMVPVSVNGFGVREATFGFYFVRLGLPLESGLLVSFVGAGVMMLFSVSGGVVYLVRKGRPAPATVTAV